MRTVQSSANIETTQLGLSKAVRQYFYGNEKTDMSCIHRIINKGCINVQARHFFIIIMAASFNRCRP